MPAYALTDTPFFAAVVRIALLRFSRLQSRKLVLAALPRTEPVEGPIRSRDDEFAMNFADEFHDICREPLFGAFRGMIQVPPAIVTVALDLCTFFVPFIDPGIYTSGVA